MTPDQTDRPLTTQGTRGRRLAMAAVAAAIVLIALPTVPALLTAWRSETTVETDAVDPAVWSELVAAGHSSGPPDARLTVVVFEDYQCHACAVWGAQLDRLRTTYASGVRIVWRYLPLDAIHPHARKAAEAAECAGRQRGFEPYHRALYLQQDRIGRAAWTAFATGTGVDAAMFDDCLARGRAATAVQRDVELARRLGFHGTPSFVINGQLYRRPPPLAHVEQLAAEASYFLPAAADAPHAPAGGRHTPVPAR